MSRQPCKIFGAYVILSFFCVAVTRAEFYFCYKGPHRVKSAECANGVILNKPTDSKCVGLTKEDATTVTVTFNASICDDSKDLPDSLVADNETITMKTDFAFQVAEFDYTTTNESDPSISPIDKTSPLGQCLTQCLPEWIDPTIPQQDDPPYEFGLSAPSADVISEQQNISHGLLTYLMDSLDPDHFPDSKVDLRLLDVFQETLSVLEKHCAPYTKPEFMKTLYAAHRFLVLHPSAGDLNDLGVWEHALIVERLRLCKDNPMKYVIESEACGDPTEPQIKLINNARPKLEGKSFRTGLFDFLVEAAWGAAEFVHGYCYKEFMTNLNLQHLHVKAMDSLFSKKVIERWTFPTKDQNGVLWSGIIGVNNIELAMRSIDACIVAGRKFSPYKGRLGRPFEKQMGSYAASRLVAQPTERQVNESEKGFKGDLDEYWEQYEANGGAKMAISGNGFCAFFEEQYDDAIKSSGLTCDSGTDQNYDSEYEDEDDDDDNDVDED